MEYTNHVVLSLGNIEQCIRFLQSCGTKPELIPCIPSDVTLMDVLGLITRLNRGITPN